MTSSGCDHLMPPDTFFAGWAGILHTIIVGVPAYAVLVFILRVSGKRSLAQMNAFDLIVTVSLGSILSMILLSRSVPFAEGITAILLLIFLQFAITWLSVRFPPFRKLVRSEPALLYHDNAFLDKTMKQQRVSHNEVLQMVRSKGISDVSEVGSVILETNGKFSVLPHAEGKPETLPSNDSSYQNNS